MTRLRKSLFTFFLSILSAAAFSQAPVNAIYYKALHIKKEGYSAVTNTISIDNKIAGIIQDLYPGMNTAQIIIALKNNPFLIGRITVEPMVGASLSGFGFAPPSLGSLDVTTIADGFAKFIVERTKKELQSAFFDRFIEELKNPRYRDLQLLFPATFTVISRLPDIVNYDPYLQSLRDAFGRDMENMLPQIENVLQNGTFSAFFDRHLELRSICLTALYVAKGLQRGTHIGKILEEYNQNATQYDFSSTQTNAIRKNAFAFVKEVSGSLRRISSTDKEYYVPADSIQLMINDEVSFRIYLALLYEKVNPIKITDQSTHSYGEAMANVANTLDELKKIFEEITGHIARVQEHVQDISKKSKEARTVADFIALAGNCIRLTESFSKNRFVADIVPVILSPAERDSVTAYIKKFNLMIEAANNVLTVYTGIQQKQYSVTITAVRNLYDLRYDPKEIRTTQPPDSIPKNKEAMENVTRFLLDKGAFIAAVAEAKTPDDVQKAINTVAMPTGSARVKRMSDFNVALNAYCGFFWGREYENLKGAPIKAYGITAPIGVSISLGRSKFLGLPAKKAGFYSHSIFISVLDLGAITTFRFKDGTTETLQTIELKDIISPGVFYSLGIAKTPISVNLGYQVTPYLREVTATNNTFKPSYSRFSISVCVDIPVLNFYTRTK